MAAPISASRALAPRGLLEREDELERLRRVVATAERGDGALAVVEGEAGIGKTALLDTVCADGIERGFFVLRARGGELERDFGFGVVRQLFEAVLAAESEAGRTLLLEGVAAIVEPVFGVGGEGASRAGQDAAFATQHGLYWLAANLAGRAPLLLCLDDAQWADPASLRWLVFLARRFEGVPAAVVVAVRSGEPGSPTELLAAVRGEAAEIVAPGPLSEAASASVVRRSERVGGRRVLSRLPRDGRRESVPVVRARQCAGARRCRGQRGGCPAGARAWAQRGRAQRAAAPIAPT